MSPRKSFAIALALAVLVASTAHAAISFFEAEVGFAISPQPLYLSVADMDGDGLEDVTVISPQSDEVNILLSAPDQPSGFSPVSVDRFGSSLRRGTTGDVSGDGNPDLIVPDQRQDGVWVLQGNGNGRLLDPSFFAIGRNPFAVAIADFDGVRGNDIAVTDARLGSVTILLNDGGAPPRFTRGPIFAVGESPETILALDANGDGEEDLVTLNVGGPRVKSISVLIFDTVRAGLPVFFPAENFGVGERPEAMNAADLNNDGFEDLVMINRPTGGGNSDINILLSQGNGVFIGPTLFEAACPFFTGGATCRSRALTTGDFDNNGTIDLAVFMTDPRRVGTGSGIENDALQIYPGRGDGQFVAGPVLRSPKIPRSAVALHLNGDDLIDLAAGFQRASNITSFVNASTSGDLANGDPCVVGGECFSGICIEGVCCASACNDNESCAIPMREGTCQRLPPPEVVCDVDDECFGFIEEGEEGFCRNGFCCEDSCPEGRCDRPGFVGLCIPTLPEGAPCVDEPECDSGFCVDGTCCREACTSGFCANDLGVCEPPVDIGQPCNVDGQCVSDICDVFTGVCCNERCDPEAEECDENGDCVPFPEPIPGEPGDSCRSDIQCLNEQCVNGVCCLDAECGEGEICQPPNGNCAPPPTPTATPVPAENGEPCDSDSLCVSGICEDFVCCDERCDDLEDPDQGLLFFCSANDGGICIEGTPPPTPTPTPLEVCRDIPCRDDEECVEDDGRGVCVDECDVPTGLCDPGETCVPGADGGEGCVDSCSEIECRNNETCVIGNNGNPVCAVPCGVGTFCERGEVCQQGELGQPLCVTSSRSGGCAVTGNGSMADLLVLLLLPLALLGVRRFESLRPARVRARK